MILVHKFDRFPRNREDSIVYKSMLRNKCHVDVVSISEPLIEGPFGGLIERIIEWMDEFYSIRLSGDVTRGMTENALRGAYQCRPPLGYRIPYHKATPEIIPEEAEIVRKIFDLYVQGNGVRKIKRYLEEHGIKTVTGKREWSTSTIDRMLSNEKYIGQVLMQKSYTPDFLTGKQVKNDGQLDMYLVDNAHEAIIDRETFDQVQEMKGHIKDTVQIQQLL